MAHLKTPIQPQQNHAPSVPSRSARRQQDQCSRAERPLNRRTTLLSIAGLGWAPGALLDALKGEASLWQQEAQLYGRKAAEALADATGSSAQQAEAEAVSAAAAAVPLDAGLAAALLAAPLQALQQQQQAGSSESGGTPASSSSSGGSSVSKFPEPPQLPQLDVERYRRDYDALFAQELPYFQEARACGHCGSVGGDDALTDRAWFDFLSYIQYKALGRQLSASLAPSGAAMSALTGWERMHASSPEMQLHSAPAAAASPPSSQVELFAAEQAWMATGQRPGAGGTYAGTPEQQLAAAAAAFKARGLAAPGAADGGGSTVDIQLTPADALRLALGTVILQHIEADLAGSAPAGAATSAAGASSAAAADGAASSDPSSSSSSSSEVDSQALLAAIRSSSPELDSIRRGGQALLSYFASRGLIEGAAVAFFGASKNEERNHYVWSLGEPAFLKYWLQAPATLRSASALDAEEGFSQDYVAATLQAYFRRCGVAATALKRYPSYSQGELVAEQWTLRRLTPLPAGYDWQRYEQWQPDYCPMADEACY